MSDELDLEDIKDDWKKATEGLASWRTESKESYDFSAGQQWNTDDAAVLEEEDRPAVTFDRVGVFIDAVSGMEVNHRQAIKYLPVEAGDAKVNQGLTDAVKYYENECGAAFEDSEAVRDAAICGIGATETLMDYERNLDGAPSVLRRDPLDVWWDPASVRRNLSDRRFQFHGSWMPLEDAEEQWKGKSFGGTIPESGSAHLADRAFLYREDSDTEIARDGQVFILHYQCWKREKFYRVKDPQTGRLVKITQKQWSGVKKLFQEKLGRDPVEKEDYIEMTGKRYYRAFLSGGDILEQGELKCNAFTFNFITYKRDRNKRSWYGLVRPMKDPQRWANKWLSTMMHIMATNAKGGAFAEVNAFQDARKAQEQWAEANPLILLKEGGIGKIQERQQSQYPSGIDKLVQFALNTMPFVTGINLEMLGLADREQAGVLEAQRRESAYTILAPLFSAIREYRKARGKLLLSFVKEYVPAGALVKISGPKGEQWVPLMKDDLTYDVRVDQAPDSPDYKRDIWDSLQTIIPAMMKAGMPIPPDLLAYSPLPDDVSQELIKWYKTSGWVPPSQKEQMAQMQSQLQDLTQKNQALQSENQQMKGSTAVEAAKLIHKEQDSLQRNEIKIHAIDQASINAELQAETQRQIAQLSAQVDLLTAAMKEQNVRRNGTAGEQSGS